jgi:Mg2+ and Co2+ transporter CorA
MINRDKAEDVLRRLRDRCFADARELQPSSDEKQRLDDICDAVTFILDEMEEHAELRSRMLEVLS